MEGGGEFRRPNRVLKGAYKTNSERRAKAARRPLRFLAQGLRSEDSPKKWARMSRLASAL